MSFLVKFESPVFLSFMEQPLLLNISLLVYPSNHLFPYKNNLLKLFLCSFLCPVPNELVPTWQGDNSYNDRS